MITKEQAFGTAQPGGKYSPVKVTRTRGTDSGPASSLIGLPFGLLTEDGNASPTGPRFFIETEETTPRFITTEQGI